MPNCPICGIHVKEENIAEIYVSNFNNLEYKRYECPKCDLHWWGPLKIIPEFYESEIFEMYISFHEGMRTRIAQNHKAFSQYVIRLHQRENLPFIKACNEWSKREKENWSIAYDYIGFSFYYQSVKKYMESLKYVKIYLYKDLMDNAVNTIQEIYEFLSVDSRFVPDNINKKYNVFGIPKNSFYKLSYNILIKYNPVKYLIKSLLPSEILETVKVKINNKFSISLN